MKIITVKMLHHMHVSYNVYIAIRQAYAIGRVIQFQYF